MTRFIKPYSFVNFFDKDWINWKDSKMIESYHYLRKKFDNLFEMAAFAGGQTKIPILFDEDDYKFLSQFPPFLWKQALVWRYNTGLLEASKLRQDDPNNSNDAIPNEKDQLVLKGTDPADKKAGERKFIFSNVYTGFRTLFHRLEHPIKNHSEHLPIGKNIGDFSGPGLRDISPFGVDDEGQPLPKDHPMHPSNYKQGLMDYDLSHPEIQSDESIDAMPEEKLIKILRDNNVEPTKTAIENLKPR